MSSKDKKGSSLSFLLPDSCLRGQVSDEEKVRNIQRRNWAGLKKSEDLEQALDTLKKIHWLRVEKIRTKGGISEIVRINPALAKKAGSL